VSPVTTDWRLSPDPDRYAALLRLLFGDRPDDDAACTDGETVVRPVS
jgi:hypothetical protein